MINTKICGVSQEKDIIEDVNHLFLSRLSSTLNVCKCPPFQMSITYAITLSPNIACLGCSAVSEGSQSQILPLGPVLSQVREMLASLGNQTEGTDGEKKDEETK